MSIMAEPTGFNLVGHVSGNLGLGVTARQVADLILRKGFPLALLDIDAGGGRGGYDQSFREYAVSSLEALPHSINLLVLPPDTICGLADIPSRRGLLLRSDRIKSALVMWEHTRLPRRWLPTLQMLDVIVAPSAFVHAAFATHLDGAMTIPAVLSIRLPDVVPSRERFGLPSGVVIFVTSFEPTSDPERKNPMAAIEAFQRAFHADSRAILLIKVHNPMVGRDLHPIVRRLRDECARDPRIRVMEDPLTYQEVLSLYGACDVFVSLHRSEGFGLALIEAMALGKPVIATAWSGNMTFMNARNSCLVSYRLVPVKATHVLYSRRLLGADVRWADPNLEDAAAWMARLVNEPSLRSTIGARAARSIVDYQKEAEQGAFLDELVAISEQLPGMPSFQSKKARLSAWERRLLRGDRRRVVRYYIDRLYKWLRPRRV